MRIEVIDGKHGIVKVRVDSEDDLWLLSLLVSRGDLVKSVTSRDVSMGEEKRRIPMILTISVEKLEFQAFTNRLRIHGIVVDGPERFGVKGSHHTISVGIGDEITLYKGVWSPKLLDEFLKLVRPIKLILVAVDFDEYSIALVQSQGMKIVDEKTISLPISGEGFEEAKERELKELARRIVEAVKRFGINTVVIASPGSIKNELKNYVEELYQNIHVYIDTVANGGYAGLQELLNRDIVRRILRDVAISEAGEMLSEFDYLLAKDINRVAYGLESIELAVAMGAIEKLAIVDDMLSSFDDTKDRVEKILRIAAEKNAKIVIVPSDTPPGQRIRMLGGAIAILRYSVELDKIE
ncbi:MAG: mRNA surveillance protein Pelota [Ignisphaera sp.]